MNKIENLREELQRRFPDGTFHMSPPVRAEDQWTLDIRYKDRWVIVDWTPPDRFAVSSASENTLYGDGPDEVYSNSEEALKRLGALLATEARTSPPLPALLSRIREDRRVTQAQIAQKLDIAQATVSGMERRKDIQLSTLQRFIEALGGVLEIVAKFPGASYVVQTGEHAQFEKRAEQTHEPLPQIKAGESSYPSLKRCGSLEGAERISERTRRRGRILAYG
jgi:transcriptional regulator with XRE-family HTH domain